MYEPIYVSQSVQDGQIEGHSRKLNRILLCTCEQATKHIGLNVPTNKGHLWNVHKLQFLFPT